jgi:hypothetical protein
MRITIPFLLTSHFSAGMTPIVLMLIYCCIYHLYIEAAILSMRLYICMLYAAKTNCVTYRALTPFSTDVFSAIFRAETAPNPLFFSAIHWQIGLTILVFEGFFGSTKMRNQVRGYLCFRLVDMRPPDNVIILVGFLVGTFLDLTNEVWESGGGSIGQSMVWLKIKFACGNKAFF